MSPSSQWRKNIPPGPRADTNTTRMPRASTRRMDSLGKKSACPYGFCSFGADRIVKGEMGKDWSQELSAEFTKQRIFAVEFAIGLLKVPKAYGKIRHNYR